MNSGSSFPHRGTHVVNCESRRSPLLGSTRSFSSHKSNVRENNLPSAKQTEHERLIEAKEKGVPWKKWGPYLSERQWGTVREDYSGDGNAWNYFSHDQARSRAYHWGEDGLAGISDDRQRLCFALALWN